MAGSQHFPCTLYRLLVHATRGQEVACLAKRNRQVVGSGQGTPVVPAELFLEALIGFPVRGQRLPELAELTKVGSQAACRHQCVRVAGPEYGPLPVQDVGVQVASVAETAQGP